MSETNQNTENKIIPKYFGMFLFIIGANLIGLTVFNRNIEVIRFLRQPSLAISFLWLLYSFPVNPKRFPFKGLALFFILFLVFLLFNIVTSIDSVNSAQYSLWLIASYLVIHQFLFVRNQLTFKQMFYQFSMAVWIIGVVSIVVSLVGAYVLGLDSFFDDRYNYSLMSVATEFSGVFGSNNSLGFITFITLVFSLFLFQINKGTSYSYFFFVFAILLNPLLIFIGNRAGMACSAMFWVLFLTYINRSWFGFLILVCFIFFSTVYFSDTLLQKFRLEQFEGGNIFGNRTELIKEALMVADVMDFFGVGYHNQRLARKAFGVVSDGDKEFNFHNTYLAVYTEFGPLGLIWIPGIILLVLFWPTARDVLPENVKFLRMLRVFAGIMMVLYLPVEDSVNSPGSPSFLFFWISLALLLIGSYPDYPAQRFYEKKSSLSD